MLRASRSRPEHRDSKKDEEYGEEEIHGALSIGRALGRHDPSILIRVARSKSDSMGACRSLGPGGPRCPDAPPTALRRRRRSSPTVERPPRPIGSPRAQRSAGAGKSGRRESWSARCLLTPRSSAISTKRRELPAGHRARSYFRARAPPSCHPVLLPGGVLRHAFCQMTDECQVLDLTCAAWTAIGTIALAVVTIALVIVTASMSPGPDVLRRWRPGVLRPRNEACCWSRCHSCSPCQGV
jgi:hypothetical protein